MVVGGERERGEKRVGGKVGGRGGIFLIFILDNFCVSQVQRLDYDDETGHLKPWQRHQAPPDAQCNHQQPQRPTRTAGNLLVSGVRHSPGNPLVSSVRRSPDSPARPKPPLQEGRMGAQGVCTSCTCRSRHSFKGSLTGGDGVESIKVF